jgi:hypothetical protein
MNRCINPSLPSPALLLLACGHSEPGPHTAPREAPSAAARSYVLRTVAGDPVPAALVDNEHVTIVKLAEMVGRPPDRGELRAQRCSHPFLFATTTLPRSAD